MEQTICVFDFNSKVYTCIFNMQLLIDEELLTFDSEEHAPNSIDSLKYVLHASSALDSFQPLIQSLTCRKDSTNSMKHHCASNNNNTVNVVFYMLINYKYTTSCSPDNKYHLMF